MPKNKLSKRQNYTSKNFLFYLSKHFIFQNAFKFHSEIIFLNFFSAQNISMQKIPEQLLQLQS